ncbi:4-(cytidine 5'-diphospho)-2-C-methyl-D-erythritol kinase [Candidatus Venteria ishoeyi]|uniref:4-diphosphocytidyl-2-C-methyl-D-erythritol kinase n=1 Tax=Candidatus Venteria ishoeyi TaxID=1899563 RepID=A0A1H6FDW2_9GAMM|nr:4-(cytidine 5'-diphospho)-2-C-methyl-D-erythritol kinase [Candidatus Venteria ishoeyi]SEH07224.1 4-diphosphocytidyl-2-C-methyl-D-erythritol kinase [Candidatus Venteria ishoeyi]
MQTPNIWLAPAKLNLFLHITGRRADGYHELQTVFQFIDLYDELHFQTNKTGILSCTYDGLTINPEQDLSLRAARLLQQHSNTTAGATIQVKKCIPVGGGVGGGSSDAATVLLALNQHWELHWSLEKLAQLGLQLGADVPIFIHGKAAWAEGVGELITPLENLATGNYLLLQPDCHISTASIFQHPDLPRNTPKISLQNFLQGASVHNDCQNLVSLCYPPVKAALDWLSGYAPARLTGTGACIFAPCDNEAMAQQALASCPAQWKIWHVKGLETTGHEASTVTGKNK